MTSCRGALAVLTLDWQGTRLLPFRAALNILFRLVAEFRSALVALALLGAMAFTTRYAGMDAAIGVAI